MSYNDTWSVMSCPFSTPRSIVIIVQWYTVNSAFRFGLALHPPKKYIRSFRLFLSFCKLQISFTVGHPVIFYKKLGAEYTNDEASIEDGSAVKRLVWGKWKQGKMGHCVLWEILIYFENLNIWCLNSINRYTLYKKNREKRVKVCPPSVVPLFRFTFS